MKKKILLIVLAVLAAALLLYGYRALFSPKAAAGAKEVTLQVLIEREAIHETFTFGTEHGFLYQLLEEKQHELGATFQSFDFGMMVSGMMNYEADAGNNEYFHIKVNGEDAMTGPQEIPLQDQDEYTFELTSW